MSSSIPSEEIARYCKFAHHVKVLHYTSIEKEFEGFKLVAQNMGDDTCMIFHIIMNGVDAFYQTYKRYPGIKFSHSIYLKVYSKKKSKVIYCY